MDGLGSGNCNFTNMDDSEAALCGVVVVSYKPSVKDRVDAIVKQHETATQQLSKLEAEKQALEAEMKRMQPQFDKALLSGTARMESMKRWEQGLPDNGTRPTMAFEDEKRLIGQQQTLLVRSFDLDDQLGGAKKNLADATQRANRATALKLDEAVAESGTICSGTLSLRSTSTIKFEIPEVRQRCDMRWMGLKNWTDTCKFDFSPVE